MNKKEHSDSVSVVNCHESPTCNFYKKLEDKELSHYWFVRTSPISTGTVDYNPVFVEGECLVYTVYE